MEFRFSINSILGNVITRIDSSTLSSCDRTKLEAIFEVVDCLGSASAKAQDLHASITTGQKLTSSNQILYILTDPAANNNAGTVLGMVKIGHKRLFLINEHGEQVEVHPTCILDFYVHESQQRRGYGKKLFQFMLQNEDVKPEHVAVDRPSHKFLSFLKKHYQLEKTIPQVNNFVIFTSFFSQYQGGITPPSSHRRNSLNIQNNIGSKDDLNRISMNWLEETTPSPSSDPHHHLHASCSVAKVVFGKDTSQFSRSFSESNTSRNSLSPSVPLQQSLSGGRRLNKSNDQRSWCRNTTRRSSSEEGSCTSPIKWHQHHTLKSSWDVLGVDPPTTSHNDR